MSSAPEDLAFRRYRDAGDPADLAAVFDAVAPELLRVARHLCRDGDVAEDLVQSTFLAAIESRRRFRDRHRVRPWLMGILTNHARMHRRRARRRPDPQRLPPREAPSPAGVAERREAHDELAVALARLPAAWQPVLRAHLLEGATAEDLAARLGRPAGTVRTQIVRGRAMLRAALPAGLAGSLALLAPCRGLPAMRSAVLAAARAAPVGMAVPGLSAMAAWSLAATLAVLVGVTVLAAPWRAPAVLPAQEDASAADPAAVLPAEAAPATPSRRDVEAPARAAVPDLGAEAVAASRVELRGRVVDERQQPCARVEVLAWTDTGEPTDTGKGWAREPAARTRSDDDGVFALPLTATEFTITARDDQRRAKLRMSGDVQGRDEIDGLQIVIGDSTELQGRVIDDHGAAVPAQRVTASSARGRSQRDVTAIAGVFLSGPVAHEAVTDAHGAFRLRCLSDYDYTYEVQHPRHPMLRVRHRASRGPLTLELAAGVTLAGRVLRSDSTPADGAEVSLHDYPSRTTRCDADGRFELVGAELRRGSYLRVDDPASAVFVLQPLPERLDDLVIRLSPPRSIAGRVVGADGYPVEGARVTVQGERQLDPGFTFDGVPTWEWANDADEMTTDTAGRFAFDRLYDGRFTVRAYPPGEKVQHVERTVAAGASDLELRLEAAAMRRVTLAGTVVDDGTGEPVPDFTVKVSQHEGSGWWGRSHVPVAPGRFEVTGLDPGELRLEVAAPGYAATTLPGQRYEIGVHTQVVRLRRVRELQVLVVDPNGEPVRADVSVRDAGGAPVMLPVGPGSSTSKLQSGAAEPLWLRGLPADLVTVVVEVHGLPDLERPVDLRRPWPQPLRIVVTRPAAVVLRTLLVESSEPVDLPDEAFASAAALEKAFALSGSAGPSRPLSLDLRSAAGALLAHADIAPIGSKSPNSSRPEWRIRSSHGSTSSSGQGETPAFELEGMATPMTLRVYDGEHAVLERAIDGTRLDPARPCPLVLVVPP